MSTPLEIAHAARSTAEWVRNPSRHDKVPGILNNAFGTTNGLDPFKEYAPAVEGVPDRFCALGYFYRELGFGSTKGETKYKGEAYQALTDTYSEVPRLVATNFNEGIWENNPDKLEFCAQVLERVAEYHEKMVPTWKSEKNSGSKKTELLTTLATTR